MNDTPRRPSLLRALAGFVILVSSLVVLMMGIVLLVTALQRGAYNERPMIEAFGILSIGGGLLAAGIALLIWELSIRYGLPR
ncbi:MAG: hypothetical protein IT178_05125 [Acidobacteria bacterium]|nr:hypothetical protein [Acidobacteriota bacterium]